jgi:hypothetical protein
MSHIVQIQTEVRDPLAIQAAATRLRLPPPTHGTFKLFTNEATGWGVQLPRWRFPVVCDTDSGTVEIDNYEGEWGDRVQLDQFLQAYAVERAKLEARKAGHSVTEQLLSDGSIKLTVQVGGAA